MNVERKDILAVLLDTSSVSKGVFRLFSPHPVSRLVSIPLSKGKDNTVCEKYRIFKNVAEDATIENVLQAFDTKDTELYFTLPHQITRNHLQMLFRPDKLYPCFATLLRFGTTYCIKRTPGSFAFWHRFYELRGVYNYIYSIVLRNNKPRNSALFLTISTMLHDLQVINHDHIIDLLKLHLLTGTVSFPIFNTCLSTLYYDEFFFSMKSPVFLQENEQNLLELFQNQWEFSNFLTQTEHIYTIAVNTIISLTVSENTLLTPEQKKSVEQLENETSALLDIARHSIGELQWDGGEEEMVKAMYFVSALYFTVTRFLKQIKLSDGSE